MVERWIWPSWPPEYETVDQVSSSVVAVGPTFLTLPSVVVQRILRYLLVSDCPIEDPHLIVRPKTQASQFLHTSILSVCKLSHRLGTKILLGENDFIFHVKRQKTLERDSNPLITQFMYRFIAFRFDLRSTGISGTHRRNLLQHFAFVGDDPIPVTRLQSDGMDSQDALDAWQDENHVTRHTNTFITFPYMIKVLGKRSSWHGTLHNNVMTFHGIDISEVSVDINDQSVDHLIFHGAGRQWSSITGDESLPAVRFFVDNLIAPPYIRYNTWAYVSTKDCDPSFSSSMSNLARMFDNMGLPEIYEAHQSSNIPSEDMGAFSTRVPSLGFKDETLASMDVEGILKPNFPFDKLPEELQLKILGFMLVRGNPVVDAHYTNPRCRNDVWKFSDEDDQRFKHLRQSSPNCALLKTCRKWYVEGIKLLYNSNTFAFTTKYNTTLDLHHWLIRPVTMFDRFGKAYKVMRSQLIRHVALTYDIIELALTDRNSEDVWLLATLDTGSGEFDAPRSQVRLLESLEWIGMRLETLHMTLDVQHPAIPLLRDYHQDIADESFSLAERALHAAKRQDATIDVRHRKGPKPVTSGFDIVDGMGLQVEQLFVRGMGNGEAAEDVKRVLRRSIEGNCDITFTGEFDQALVVDYHSIWPKSIIQNDDDPLCSEWHNLMRMSIRLYGH